MDKSPIPCILAEAPQPDAYGSCQIWMRLLPASTM